MRILSFSTILLAWLQLYPVAAQQNIALLSKVDYQALHGTALNDIWGYVGIGGKEYACVGTRDGVGIVDVTNPSSPVEVFWIAGPHSVWRDLKTHDNRLYVTNETGGGLMIIDMTSLPWTSNLPVYYYTGGGLNSAHNLFIDEFGYCYIFGSNVGNRGTLILNLASPNNPVQVGVFDDWYAHDGYVKNNKLYGAHIRDGFFSVVDVSNKSMPQVLATQVTPNVFTHNVWISDDEKYLYSTDEVSSGFIGAYDISDLSNIKEIDREQVNAGTGVIPHNTHVLGDYLVTSYYKSGVTIHSTLLEDNIVLVGSYDTSPEEGAGYSGCWGAYPYLPSGLILATDMVEGLFVLQPTYVVPGYLEGVVKDKQTGHNLSGAHVEILGIDDIEKSNLVGEYRAGVAASGTYNVAVSRFGYVSDTLRNVVLTSGHVVVRNVNLQHVPTFNLTGQVVTNGDNIPVANATVNVQGTEISMSVTTNGDGEFTLPAIYHDIYNVHAGAWGYGTSCADVELSDGMVFKIELPLGFADDFSFDHGWLETGSATSGLWTRGKPYGTLLVESKANPDKDIVSDCHDYAYVTGNSGLGPNDDDVDGGNTKLTSPVFDGTQFIDPWINYYLWFFNGGGTFLAPNDQISVKLYNGSTTATLTSMTAADSMMSKWNFYSKHISDYITPTSTMQLIVETADDVLFAHTVEAGFDGFSITAHREGVGISEAVGGRSDLKVYPNPMRGDRLFFELPQGFSPIKLQLIDMQGRLVVSDLSNTTQGSIPIGNLNAGLYILVAEGPEERLVAKVLKE